jgi:hypothetical protein
LTFKFDEVSNLCAGRELVGKLAKPFGLDPQGAGRIVFVGERIDARGPLIASWPCGPPGADVV